MTSSVMLKTEKSRALSILMQKFSKLIDKPYGKLVIKKHQNRLYMEETDKDKILIA